jgi:hypothetical protein
MIMKKLAGILLGLGLALNAHALCVNPGGSPDDPSVPASSASGQHYEAAAQPSRI